MCGAECWTDHRLLISKLNIIIQPPRRPQGKKVPQRLNVSKLKYAQVKQSLAEELDSKLEPLNFDLDDVDSDWITFRDAVYAAKEVLGPTTRKHFWFDDNNERIQSLLDEKHRLHRSYLNDPFSARKKRCFQQH